MAEGFNAGTCLRLKLVTIMRGFTIITTNKDRTLKKTLKFLPLCYIFLSQIVLYPCSTTPTTGDRGALAFTVHPDAEIQKEERELATDK